MSSSDSPASIASQANVATSRGARYAKQLTAHLGHRLHTSWDETALTGLIRFESGACTVIASEEHLALRIELEDDAVQTDVAADLDRMEDVVGRHLVRFGARDELRVDWTRSDGSPSTHQVKTSD